MGWLSIGELVQEHLTPGLVLTSIVGLVIIFFLTIFAKDLRASVYILLLSIVLTALQNPVLHMTFYLLRWIILVLITTRVILGKTKAKTSLLQILFLIWVCVAFLSVVQCQSITRGLVFAVVYLLCFFVFFVLVISEINTEQDLQKWFNMLIFLGWTFFALAMFSFIKNPSSFSSSAQGRMAGLFANPMKMSRILVFSFSIFIWNGLRTKKNWLKQIIYFALSFPCLYILFRAGSRGALGGIVITMAVFALHYRKKMVFLIVPTVAMASIYIIPKILAVATTQFVTHISSLESESRMLLLRKAFDLFKQRPILGWGLGTLSDPKSSVLYGFLSVHNSYLNFLLEFGLLGFFVVMTTIIYCYYRIFKLAFFDAKTDFMKDAAWFTFASLTTLFGWNFVDGALSQPAQMHFYWMLLFFAITEAMIQINGQLEPEILPQYYDQYDQFCDCHDQNVEHAYSSQNDGVW